MNRHLRVVPLGVISCVVLASYPARAEIDVGSDGSDDAFNPTGDHAFDLTQAASLCDCDGIDQGDDLDFIDDPCRWDCPSPEPGQGVYDAEQWAIVFKWTSVNIPSGVNVTFATNHYSRAPVVWLAQENIQVAGTINMNGKTGTATPGSFAEPGPGGYRGGRGTGGVSTGASAGMGPGGTSCHGDYGATNGGAGPIGNAAVLPLLGGSGGGAHHNVNGTSPQSQGGGGGGGALLAAANSTITITSTGQVLANGGCGSCAGAGGAIRLVADSVVINGALQARVGAGCCCFDRRGRIRVEGNDVAYTNSGDPTLVEDLPTFLFPPANAPKLRAVLLDGQTVPSDPKSIINDPDLADVQLMTLSAVTMSIEAENVPVNTTVSVRVIPAETLATTVTSSPLVDPEPDGILTASASVSFPAGYSTVMMRATFDPELLFLRRPEDTFRKPGGEKHGEVKTLNGERITKTEVISNPAGNQQVVYVTETGRRIPMGR